MNAKPIFKHFHYHSYMTTANPICTVYMEKTFLFSFFKLNLGLETKVDFFPTHASAWKKNYKHSSYSLANKSVMRKAEFEPSSHSQKFNWLPGANCQERKQILLWIWGGLKAISDHRKCNPRLSVTLILHLESRILHSLWVHNKYLLFNRHSKLLGLTCYY